MKTAKRHSIKERKGANQTQGAYRATLYSYFICTHITRAKFWTKAAFELAVNAFWKSFSTWPACLAATENRIFGKLKSVWPKFYSFDSEMVLQFHFTFKPFQGHAQKRERARERERDKERRESRDRRDRSPRSSAKIVRRGEIVLRDHRDRVKHRADRSPSSNPVASLCSFFS